MTQPLRDEREISASPWDFREPTEQEKAEELEDIRQFQQDQAEAYRDIRGAIESRIALRLWMHDSLRVTGSRLLDF
jgi:hypothetical protein